MSWEVDTYLQFEDQADGSVILCGYIKMQIPVGVTPPRLRL